MTAPLPRRVVHHGLFDPRRTTGGVETFARNLELVFDEVIFSTPETIDVERVEREGLPVICDNQHVLDWPEHIPVIGFQHGVAFEKLFQVRDAGMVRMAWNQRKAAHRPLTLWVACANWISRRFARLHGNRASHVIYHAVDLTRFDGVRPASVEGTNRLVLHDARTPHKGSIQLGWITEHFPEWKFEPLACRPDEVPERMRGAAAFVHLSKYEGNSIVCNEAMAMNLPCLFTDVGLMRDGSEQFDVDVVPRRMAFRDRKALLDHVGRFLGSLGSRHYEPRTWVLEHATRDRNIEAWRAALEDFDRMAENSQRGGA